MKTHTAEILKTLQGEPGKDGKDYVLTEADRTEIAQLAADMVDVQIPDVPEGAATEDWVKDYAQPKGEYLTQSDLQSATDNALAQAKASGEFDGKDGADGSNGKDGQDGSAGKDGISVTHSWNGTTLTVTSASGTSSADLKGEKGDTGATGSAGKDGTSVTVSNVSTSTADGGSNVVTFSDGKTLTVKNGSKGSKGDKGDAYTLTATDKNAIVQAVLAEIESGDGVNY